MKKGITKGSISDLVLGKLSPEESLRLLEEIELDPSASEELEIAAGIAHLAEIQGDEVFGPAPGLPAREIRKRGTVAERLEPYLHTKKLAYPAAAFVSVCVILLGLVATSHLLQDEYHTLASVEDVEFDSRVRGADQEDLAAARQLYAEGRWDESIRILERYIRAFPESEAIDYAHYSAGAYYLLSSHTSLLSLFPSYDQEHVIRGLAHLDTAIHVSTNLRIIENSHWLRAKAFLMLHRPADALVELEKLKFLGGTRSRQALELISEIQRIEKKE